MNEGYTPVNKTALEPMLSSPATYLSCSQMDSWDRVTLIHQGQELLSRYGSYSEEWVAGFLLGWNCLELLSHRVLGQHGGAVPLGRHY